MGSDTTEVDGRAISDFCVLHGGMLNIDIYDTPRDDLPDALKPYWDINKEHWVKHPEIQFDDPDGYRACLYLPKNRGSDGVGACPPVMVYRGSDMESSDVEKLIFGLQGRIHFLLDLPWFPGVPDDVEFTENFDHSAGLLPELMGFSMSNLRARPDLTEETMFIGETGETRFNVTIPVLRDGRAVVDWTVTSSLYYGETGDWPVNFAQGLGQVPEQYRKAIRHGRLAAQVADAEWDGRIAFTGHSLGGGLASAGAISARKSSENLVMRATTYNAAGLHPNTAAVMNATTGDAADVPVRAFHVHSEILNSMQSPQRIVPFIADLLHWADKRMPAAVANPTARVGVSPGPMPISGVTLRPEGAALPRVFPVRNEELVQSGLPELRPIIEAAAGARDINDFMGRVIQHLIGRISAGAQLHHSEASALQELTLPSLDTLTPQLIAAVMTGAPVPSLSFGTSAYAVATINPFANALLADLVALARIMLASGEYHTFLPCAYTFLLPRS